MEKNSRYQNNTYKFSFLQFFDFTFGFFQLFDLTRNSQGIQMKKHTRRYYRNQLKIVIALMTLSKMRIAKIGN